MLYTIHIIYLFIKDLELLLIYRLDVIKTCGTNILLLVPVDLNAVEKVEMSDIKHPLDWFTLDEGDYVIENVTHLKLLLHMDKVKENNAYYLRVTMTDGTQSEMFFNKISLKGIIIIEDIIYNQTSYKINLSKKKEKETTLINRNICILLV